MQRAEDHCRTRIADYTCIFIKQERLAGQLTPIQRISLRYRTAPQSVYLRWLDNPGRARRAVFVRGRDVDAAGQALAVIEPAAALARLLAPAVRIAVDGAAARAASRQTLDHAGCLGTYASLARVHARAAARGELILEYVGGGTVDGRPTYVLERRLPYDPAGPRYPNARLILHVDQQTLLPVGVYTYAGTADGAPLLGSYTMTQVQTNVGLTDAAFTLR